MLWYDFVGLAGTFCFLLAYFLLERGSWGAHDLRYLGANLLGAVLVLISLAMDWNLASFMLEVAWAFISMMGIFKVLKKRKAR